MEVPCPHPPAQAVTILEPTARELCCTCMWGAILAGLQYLSRWLVVRCQLNRKSVKVVANEVEPDFAVNAAAPG